MQAIRLGWIESLRGLAVLLVVFIHLLKSMDLAHYLDHENVISAVVFAITDVVDPGKTGVIIFFLVSGWLVPQLVLRQSTAGFLKNRFWRLYPAYWLSIAWTLAYCYRPGWLVIAMNVTMFHKFFGVNDLVSVYWTLQIELAFYFLCLYMKRKGWLSDPGSLKKLIYAFLCFALLLAAARFLLNLKLPVALPLGLAVMLTAQLWRLSSEARDTEGRKPLRQAVLAFALLFIPICFLAYNRDYGYHETWYRYLASYAVAFLIFAWFKKTGAEPRALVFTGKISYSMYLLHLVTGVAFIHTASVTGLDVRLGYTSIVGMAMGFILAASVISYYGVERPLVRFGKRIGQVN